MTRRRGLPLLAAVVTLCIAAPPLTQPLAAQVGDAHPAVQELLGVPAFAESAAGWDLEHASVASDPGPDGAAVVVLEAKRLFRGAAGVTTWIGLVVPGSVLSLRVEAQGETKAARLRLEAWAMDWDTAGQTWRRLKSWSEAASLDTPEAWTPLGLEIEVPEQTLLVCLRISSSASTPVRLRGVSVRSHLEAGRAEEGTLAAWSVARLHAERARIGALVAASRGREFPHATPARIVPGAALRADRARSDTWLPADDAAHLQTMLGMLGLWPDEAVLDVQGLMSGRSGDTVAGMLHTVTGTVALHDAVPQDQGILVLAHELCHALEYATIPAMTSHSHDHALHDLDGHLVRRILEEGSATLTMARVERRLVADGTIDADLIDRVGEESARRWGGDPRVPALGRRLLTAPYSVGQTFLKRGDVGRDADTVPTSDLDQALEDPPRSTEQLLHPERYWDPERRDAPRPVALSDLSDAVGPEWALVATGTLGELLLAQFVPGEFTVLPSVKGSDLSLWTTAATDGWDGDAWQVYAFGERRLVLLATCWDSDEDAAEFHAALRDARPELHLRREGDLVVAAAGGRVILGDRLADAALRDLRSR